MNFGTLQFVIGFVLPRYLFLERLFTSALDIVSFSSVCFLVLCISRIVLLVVLFAGSFDIFESFQLFLSPLVDFDHVGHLRTIQILSIVNFAIIYKNSLKYS